MMVLPHSQYSKNCTWPGNEAELHLQVMHEGNVHVIAYVSLMFILLKMLGGTQLLVVQYLPVLRITYLRLTV